ncbi:hypothetical protein SUGI_0791650 [Cryptomeria japonica]|nr:hypothetical protein SUGI_0791650 [Cryptomeria japonica]
MIIDKLDHIEHNRMVMDANGGEGSASHHHGPAPTCNLSIQCKGLSDTEFEYDKGSDEDFLQADELDNVDPRCISQSANVLLRKSKRFRGKRSNTRLREDRAKEKGQAKATRIRADWVGAIVRDEFGFILKSFSSPVSIATNNVAEISVLEVGLKWCVSKRIDKRVIEGDSQIILNGISSSKFQNWLLENWIPRIKMFLDLLGDFHIQHMFWEGNKSAHVLANLGIEESCVIEYDSVDAFPEGVQNIISQDRDLIPRQGIG